MPNAVFANPVACSLQAKLSLSHKWERESRDPQSNKKTDLSADFPATLSGYFRFKAYTSSFFSSAGKQGECFPGLTFADVWLCTLPNRASIHDSLVFSLHTEQPVFNARALDAFGIKSDNGLLELFAFNANCIYVLLEVIWK